MRRRQAIQEREAVRRMLNVEPAEMPVLSQEPEPAAETAAPKRRGRPRKVKDDNAG